jgi:hypothetical protein
MRSSCRPQSELGLLLKDLLHLAVLRLVVVGIVSCVQPRASRDMLTWRHPRLPPPLLSRNFRFGAKAGVVSYDTYNIRRGLRSLPHLREQLKPRTDDGHASPAKLSEGDLSFPKYSVWISSPGKVLRLVYELSHMIHRLCKSPSIPLSFSLAVVLPRRQT